MNIEGEFYRAFDNKGRGIFLNPLVDFLERGGKDLQEISLLLAEDGR